MKERVVVIHRSKDGEGTARVEHDGDVRVFHLKKGDKLDDPELQKKLDELGVRLGNLDKEMAERNVLISRRMAEVGPRLAEIGPRIAEAHARGARAMAMVPVVVDCADGEGRKEATTPDGNRVVRLCRKEPHGSGVMRLRMARDQIARQSGMDESTKSEVLRSLDREIERLEAAK